MFIEGKPGSGKSTLLRYFTDNFKPPMDGAIVAKFFYSHKEEKPERSQKSMLQYLLHEILDKDESFFMHFQQEYRNLSGPEAWEYEKLKGVLEACLDHRQKRTIFLVIDAMDESDDCYRNDTVQFLWVLSLATNKSCVVKILLASCPINEIHHVRIPVRQRIRLHEKNRDDIEKFTRHFLEKPIFRGCENGTREEIRNYIVDHAAGFFLWVRVVGDELENCCMRGLSLDMKLKQPEKLAMKLEDYYAKMVRELKGSCEDDARDGTRILQFCLFSHRAVELLELRDALAIPGGTSPPSLDLAPFSWEEFKPGDIICRLTNCAGRFLEIKSMYASVSGEFPGSDEKTFPPANAHPLMEISFC